MITYSGHTTHSGNFYVHQSYGGVGLFGISSTPDLAGYIGALEADSPYDTELIGYIRPTVESEVGLQAMVTVVHSGYGELLGAINDQLKSEAELYGFVTVATSTHTASTPNCYLNIINGGVGFYGVDYSPDLLANILSQPKGFDKGDRDLYAEIVAIRKGEFDLYGYLRSAASGTLSLDGSISGSLPFDLSGYLRPLFSGSEDLETVVEPIPPEDLLGEIQGVYSSDIGANITLIPPSPLIGSISGVRYVDLCATLEGYDFYSLGASVSGVFKQDLLADILSKGEDTALLSGAIAGVKGVEQEAGLLGYISPMVQSSSSISGSLLATQRGDLGGNYPVAYTWEGLSGSISGVGSDWLLYANLSAAGGAIDLLSAISRQDQGVAELAAAIDGYGHYELSGILNTAIGENLNASLTVAGVNNQYLQANIDNNLLDIYATYVAHNEDLLAATVLPVSPLDLGGVITPKVYFIDSSIPLNLYALEDLVALVNADICSGSSFFGDLHVSISGVLSTDLEASMTAIAGQYAKATDQLSLSLKNMVVSENWVFVITSPPILNENLLELVLTNSPLADLGAYIDGILFSQDLSASIDSKYVATTIKAGTEIGEWVNTLTGERKVIKLYFKGNVKNFYYSPDSHTTFAEDSNSYLEMFVESYDKVDQDLLDTLLYQKTSVKRHVIKNLQEFGSIDEAVKFAIMGAVSEIKQELGASIEAIGGVSSLATAISGIDADHLSDLRASVTAAANDPILYGEVVSQGGVGSLGAHAVGYSYGETTTQIEDTLGVRYLPKLVVHGSDYYSVILAKSISSDPINIAITPDLVANIQGIQYNDIESSISGTI